MEKAPQPHLRHFVGDVFFVETRTGALNGAFTQVRAEDLDGNLHPHFGEHLYQRNGVGVGLLAAGTAWDPDSHRFQSATFRQDLGIYDVAQALKHIRIAEETGDIDQDVAIKRFYFFGFAVKELDVIPEV